ncbi:MAG: hydrolase [Christensenellaceae bacterium]|jgi:hypothetical protein|nr:hydrolase [Christensenellaceae bacterium]
MDCKEDFIEIYETFIDRSGSDRLLEYLKSSDFFVAPASTKFHLCVEGGLCKHSLNVYEQLLKLVELAYGENWENVYSHETVAICGLLHDLCKIGLYKIEQRNVKDQYGWTKSNYYVYDDSLPYGHGEKSVYIINGYLRLTRDEAMAINWHMGGFDDRAKYNALTLSRAFEQFPIAVLLHMADMSATYLVETPPRQ